MVQKRICLLICACVGIVVPVDWVYAVNATDIEAVRGRTLQSKSALTPADEAVIDQFMKNGLTELIQEEDPWRAVDVREAVVAQKGGPDPSPYAAAFANAAARNLKVTLEDAARLQDPQRQRRITLNLVIIAASLQSPEIVQFGLDMLANTDRTIQYWAVKTVANPGLAAQLTSQVMGDDELTRRILARLDQAVTEAMAAETLRIIVEFSDKVDTAEARALVSKVTDLRIRQYADWTVQYELLDMLVLSSLSRQIQAEPADARRADLLRRFAQLYSYVIERYVLGENTLTELQKQQLASVIAETENGAVTQLLGRPQDRLRKAIEGGKGPVLETERQILLGSATQAGQLAGKFVYDYGKAAGGAAITEPLRLKAPAPVAPVAPAAPSGGENPAQP